MTALEKFIKQIVLKQVKGLVYLVPAICDFQIEEALEEEKKQGQTLPIQNVSKKFYCHTKRGCLEQCNDCALIELNPPF